MKDRSSLSFYRARNKSVPFCPPRGSRLAIDSSSALNASSLFLNRYMVPNPFMLTRASLPVFRLVSISAAKRSVRAFLTNSLEEFVTRDSDANERMESSAFEIDYTKQIKLDITALLTESLFLYFSSYACLDSLHSS